jgi:hypothetical protein
MYMHLLLVRRWGKPQTLPYPPPPGFAQSLPYGLPLRPKHPTQAGHPTAYDQALDNFLAGNIENIDLIPSAALQSEISPPAGR